MTHRIHFIAMLAALMVLLGRVGAGRKVSGEILEVHRLPALRVVRTTLRLASGWPGHEAGQFAFVTTHRAEGAHPYTIASHWDPATREITFITKALNGGLRADVVRLRDGAHQLDTGAQRLTGGLSSSTRQSRGRGRVST